MADLLLHSVSEGGVKRYWRSNGDGTHDVVAFQDLDPILDECKAMATHNDGYSESRNLRRVAFIPDIIALKWLNEEGFWYLDPNAADKVRQKLNCSDYAHLRTAPGRF